MAYKITREALMEDAAALEREGSDILDRIIQSRMRHDVSAKTEGELMLWMEKHTVSIQQFLGCLLQEESKESGEEWISEDKTFCMNDNCEVQNCERNPAHIKRRDIPHSYAYFEGTSTCPIKRVEAVRKIVYVGEEQIAFDDGSTITYDHERDCCECNWADFEQLEDEARNYSFIGDLVFEGVEDEGFRFGDKRRMFFVPCYSDQNGYYSADLDIYYNGKEVLNIICEERI